MGYLLSKSVEVMTGYQIGL